MSRSFRFVRFDLPGAIGLADGRYPVRAANADGPPATVIVARTAGAPPAQRRRRRAKARPAGEEPPPVALTELTVVESEPIAGDPEEWLEGVRRDGDRRAVAVAAALAQARRAVAARRVAAADPAIADPALHLMAAVRIGYGSGDELVEGRFAAAIEVPRESERPGRTAALRPQERAAAILGGRERPLACEELLLRARADLEGARPRHAALQLRVALEALLAERERLDAPAQAEDLASLDSRRQVTGAAANEALAGELTSERTREVADTLAACERILRRRAAAG